MNHTIEDVIINKLKFDKYKNSDFFIKTSINELKNTDSDEEVSNIRIILYNYLFEEVSDGEFEKICDDIIFKKLCVDKENISDSDFKENIKTSLIHYFLVIYLPNIVDNRDEPGYTNNTQLLDESIFTVIQEIVGFKDVDAYYEVDYDYDYYNEKSNDCKILIDISDYYDEELTKEKNNKKNYKYIADLEGIQFKFISEKYGEFEDIKSECIIIIGTDNIVEAIFSQDSNQVVDLSPGTMEDLYMRCNIVEFMPTYIWENVLLESFKFYNNKRYDLAFFNSFIALESFIEWCIFNFKEKFKDEIVDWMVNNENEDDLGNLLNYLLSNEDFNNTDIKNKVYFYKKINNDKRNLINDKFKDVTNIINYFGHINKNKEIPSDKLFIKNNNLYGDNKNVYLIDLKTRLDKLSDVRNNLAHGDKLEDEYSSENAKSDEKFLRSYLDVLSAFCFIILFWKDEIDLSLLNKNVNDR